MPVIIDTAEEKKEGRSNDPAVFNSDFFNALKSKLQDFLENYETNISFGGSTPLVDKFTCTMEPTRLISILPRLQSSLKAYWESRDTSFSALALGAIYKIKQDLIGDSQLFLCENGYYDFRFYGVLPFESSKRLKGKWKDFNKTHFFLPRFEFVQKGSVSFFSVYFLPGKIQELWKDFHELEESFQFSIETKRISPKASIKNRTPSRANWTKLVNTIKRYIQRGVIDKLVLGRLIEGSLNERVDIGCFAQELAKSLKENYIFLFQSGDSSFLSFSPEKLLEVKSDIIATEAIAGSEHEASSENSGIHSIMNPKNIREQKIVEEEILAYLKKISNGLYFGQGKQVLNLGYIKHIKSSFNAVMQKFYIFSDLLNLFHPTSAVCGIPKNPAKKLLSKLEKFQRGLYAAPCGFFSAMEAEFAVGIRSVLIKKKKIYFFSGAGIIGTSSAENEWQELNHKLKPFQSLFHFNDL